MSKSSERAHSLHIFAWICASKLLLWLLLLLLFRCEYAPCHTYAWPSAICVFLCAQDLSNCSTFISISYWYGHVCNYLCWLRCVCSAFRSQSHCFFSFVFCSFVFHSLDSCVLFTYNAFRTRLGHWFIFWTFFNMHLYMFEFVFVFHDVNGLLFAHNVKLQCRTLYAYRSDLYRHMYNCIYGSYNQCFNPPRIHMNVGIICVSSYALRLLTCR